ncbi:uncharacterized protein RAG0_08167 [Rhynchosporium agropyri]|uniref:Clr5 domain-containing protein n=1 Tax=Rhynchosporium agropyri TaxID=914238 RepID=A0A1E1KSG6_9HELO|nr:uncharacterized protein RAG0_08167 [Rhynchosporium agropyri]
MYPLKGMKLRNIREMLVQDHAFIVNERQLKKKIDDWEIGKNVQGSEMTFIAQKQYQRTLARKPIDFCVRAVPSTPSDVAYSPASTSPKSPHSMEAIDRSNEPLKRPDMEWLANDDRQFATSVEGPATVSPLGA